MKKYDVAVLDFETMNNHTNSPCEVGISLISGLNIENTYSSYINPPNNFFSSINAKIHNISKNTISEAPVFESIYSEIKSIIQSAHIVIAHNAHFDISVLKSTIETCNLTPFEYIYIDSVNIFKYFHGNVSVSMDNLCNMYGINKQNLHSAKYDVQALSTILLKLTDDMGLESILELIQTMNKQYIKFSQLTNVQKSINIFTFNQNKFKISDINKVPIEINDNLFLKDKNIVFTGEFELGKTELMILIRKNGGNIRSTVSAKTNILIEGVQEDRYKDENGLVSKQRKARKLISQGIEIDIIDEKELLKMIGDIENA